MPDGEPLEMERKALVLDLAKGGHEQAMRSWRAFERDEPVSAAAVVKHLDGTLTKAGTRDISGVQPPEAMRRAMLAEWADDSDPSLRSSARNALAALDGAR
jgi:hypothetical protein